jgi:hypothetical protein
MIDNNKLNIKIENLANKTNKLVPTCSLIVAVFLINISISYIFEKKSLAIFEDWIPSLKILLKISYNNSLVSYITILAVIFCYLLYKYNIKDEYRDKLRQTISTNLPLIVIVNYLLIHNSNYSSIPKNLTILILVVNILILTINSKYLLAIIYKVLDVQFSLYKLLMVITISFCGILFIANWYPIKIPNNYQLIDTTYLISNKHSIQKSKIYECLEASSPDETCYDLDLSKKNLEEIDVSTKIESGQDGILYHHSFVILPALHIIKYGLNESFHYLYGIGSTYFTAILLSYFGSNISGYFNSYPLTQFIGAFSLTLLILLITRSFLASLIASLLVIFVLVHIKFEYILLAPGFNPIRYFGICFQLFGIIYHYKNKNKYSYFFMAVSSVFSTFWNFELGVMGVLSQISYVLMDNVKSFKSKIKQIIFLILIMISGAIYVKYITGSYIQTMELAIFGLFPYLSYSKFLILIIFLSLFSFIYIKIVNNNFNYNERKTRYSILIFIILTTTKYIFYPAKVHLYAGLLIPSILFLTCFNWKAEKVSYYQYYIKLILIILILMTLGKSITYYEQGNKFINLTMENFKKSQWTQLGESFSTTTPIQKIIDRVESIKLQVSDSNALLILSPYDHLLNIYLNPKSICGHFELNLNLLTESFINKVVDCARKEKDVIIVLDSDIYLKCIPNIYTDKNKCDVYNLSKDGPIFVIKKLSPYLQLINSDGELSYYKIKNDK